MRRVLRLLLAPVHARAQSAAEEQRGVVLLVVQRVEIPGRVLGALPVKLELEPVGSLDDFFLNLLRAHVRLFQLRELSLPGLLVPQPAPLGLALALLLAASLAGPVAGVYAVYRAVAPRLRRGSLLRQSLQRRLLPLFFAHERGLGLGLGVLLALLEELLERQRLRGMNGAGFVRGVGVWGAESERRGGI